MGPLRLIFSAYPTGCIFRCHAKYKLASATAYPPFFLMLLYMLKANNPVPLLLPPQHLQEAREYLMQLTCSHRAAVYSKLLNKCHSPVIQHVG